MFLSQGRDARQPPWRGPASKCGRIFESWANKHLSWTLHTFCRIGTEMCIQNSHLCSRSLSIPAQRRCRGRAVPPESEERGLCLNWMAFSFMQKGIIVFSAQCRVFWSSAAFSHPLSLVGSWRTLAVLASYLILVSGGRTHPFFMVYMHTTTNSKDLVPGPKGESLHSSVAFLQQSFGTNNLQNYSNSYLAMHIQLAVGLVLVMNIIRFQHIITMNFLKTKAELSLLERSSVNIHCCSGNQRTKASLWCWMDFCSQWINVGLRTRGGGYWYSPGGAFGSYIVPLLIASID